MTDENVYEAPQSELVGDQEVEYHFAGFWIRVLASIIDSILILVVTVPLLIAIYGTGYWEGEAIAGFSDILISYILPIVAIILFWVYKAATPGKMILGLRIISLGENEKMSVGQAIGRYFAYIPAYVILCLGILWVGFDKRKQGWHDKLANTAVVKN